MKRKINIMRQISALAMGIMLAAQSFTALADTKITKGDVNGDGSIDVTDIAVTAAHIKGIKAVAKDEADRADVNSDGNINVTDVAMIAAHIKGIKALPETNSKSENSSGTDSKPESSSGTDNKPESSSKTDSTPDSSSETENNEPVHELKNISGDNVLGGANGKLVVCNNDEYKVIDTKSGKIERTFKCKDDLKFAGLKKDGTLIMLKIADGICEEIYSYPPDKDKPKIIKTTIYKPDPIFDEKTDTVYLNYGDSIYKLNDDGTLEKVKQIKGGSSEGFVGTDVSRMISGLLKDDGEFKGFPKLRTISVSDDKTLWETLTYNGSIAYTKNMAVAYDSISDEDNTVSELRCFDIRTGEKKGIYETSGSVTNIFASDKTDNCILRKSVKSYKDFEDHVTVFNAATGKATYVDIGVKDIVVCNAMCIDENTWAVSVASPTLMSQEMPAPDFTDEWMVGSYAGGGLDESVTRTFIIRTDKQKFNKLDEGQDIEGLKDKLLKHCGEALKAQREKADKLEEKYGVTILIGDEVLNADGVWNSTETAMYDSYPEELDDELDDLDLWMSAYPEGFFEKFKTSTNKNGYRILFVDDYDEEAQDLSRYGIGGMTSYGLNFIDVSIGNGNASYDLLGTMDHETWHAVEKLIELENMHYFDEDEWVKFNPTDFVYYNFAGIDNETYEAENQKFLIGGTSNDKDNAYFTNNYSETNPLEDRATIVEYLRPSGVVTYSGMNDKAIENYPHIKAKLDYMGEWSKQHFGYVYWDEMKNKQYVEPDVKIDNELRSLANDTVIASAHGKLVSSVSTSSKKMDGTYFEYNVIDVKNDKIEYTFTTDEYLEYGGIKNDGTVVMWNSAANKGLSIYFFTPGQDGAEIIQTDIAHAYLTFDENSDTIYLNDNKTIYKLKADGTLEEIAKCGESESFNYMDPYHMLGFIGSNDSETDELKVISLSDGKTLWKTGPDVFGKYTTKDYVIVTERNLNDPTGSLILHCFDPMTGEEKNTYELDSSICSIFTSAKSDLFINKSPKNSITVSDPMTLETADINIDIRTMYITNAVCIDENTWAVTMDLSPLGKYSKNVIKTVLINTNDLEFTKLQ